MPYVEEYFETDTVPNLLKRTRDEVRYGLYYRLTDAGRVFAAEAAPKIEQTIPVVGKAETDCLRSLAFRPDSWVRPMDCGGTNGSVHSAALFNLTLNGLATMQSFGRERSGVEAYPLPHIFKRGKGSRKFKITPAGLLASKQK